MNPHLIAALADEHIRETRHEAGRAYSRPASQPDSQPLNRARLRRRVGITLVEAGMRLLATTPAVPGR